jgi:hypothetical protein
MMKGQLKKATLAGMHPKESEDFEKSTLLKEKG